MNFVEDTAARYCCAVVGSQSVCHVCSFCLLEGDKLAVIENVCDLILYGNKRALFDSFSLRMRLCMPMACTRLVQEAAWAPGVNPCTLPRGHPWSLSTYHTPLGVH